MGGGGVRTRLAADVCVVITRGKGKKLCEGTKWVGGRRGSRRFLFRSDVAVSRCPKRLLFSPSPPIVHHFGRDGGGGRREADKSCAVSPSRSPAFSSVGGRRMTDRMDCGGGGQTSFLPPSFSRIPPAEEEKNRCPPFPPLVSRLAAPSFSGSVFFSGHRLGRTK